MLHVWASGLFWTQESSTGRYHRPEGGSEEQNHKIIGLNPTYIFNIALVLFNIYCFHMHTKQQNKSSFQPLPFSNIQTENSEN